MHNVFLIYELVPERTDFYLLSQLSDEQYSKIIRCHGNFVNQVNNDEIDDILSWLIDFLEDKQKLLYAQGNPFFMENNGKFAIVHTGLLL